MYQKSIDLLCLNDIDLLPGLSEVEIRKIESLYHFSFPFPLESFLKEVLPINKGFYNWRDFSKENILCITSIMEAPKNALTKMAKEVYWCEKWGEEPKSFKDKIEVVRTKVANAPNLIPIFAHRYMPVCNLQKPPIISVHGTDVIYYGEDLENYLEIEFGDRKQLSIKLENIEHVPFWSDLV